MTEKLKIALDSKVFDYLVKLVVIVVLPWGVWVTHNIFDCQKFMNRGDRFTLQMGYDMERRMDERHDALPPPLWRDAVNRNAAELSILRSMFRDMENEITRDFVRKDELP